LRSQLKVIQVPYCFHPDAIGGTEVYVESLSKHLQKRDVEVVITAPGKRDASYMHGELKVRRFAVGRVNDPHDLYGEGDIRAAETFGQILDEEFPELVHVHAFTRAVSLRLVREAKRRGIPVVFSYHTPTVSCQRGTLMRWGREVCEGRLNTDLCTRCTLQGLGLPRPLSDLVGRMPVVCGNVLGKAHLSGGIWTALRMRFLIQTRHQTLRTFVSEVDHIVVLCQWTLELLKNNGVPFEKMTLSRHGLNRSLPMQPHSELTKKPGTSLPLKLIFLGRLDPTKGIDILIKAVTASPQLSLSLDLYFINQGEDNSVYLEQLRNLASYDSRISFHFGKDGKEIAAILPRYDLLVAPSQWLETGPLVVLEAFAAGIPVLGSKLGGIAELVQHEVNGLLVEFNSLQAWRDALRRLCEEKDLLGKLRSGIQPPRQMEEVAREMEALYLRCISLKKGA